MLKFLSRLIMLFVQCLRLLLFVVKVCNNLVDSLVRIYAQGAIIVKAVGRFAGFVIATWRREICYIRRTWKEIEATPKQLEVRRLYSEVDRLWRRLSREEKEAWRKIARGEGISNYAAFMAVNLKRAFAGEPLLRIPEEGGE